jgi:hypothetical protein
MPNHVVVLAFALAILLPVSSSADSSLPFLKDLAGDTELPRTWGFSLDYFVMDQDYDIANLEFALPGVGLGDPSLLAVTNDVKHFDLQADVWLFPFMNVFAIVGQVNTHTFVDLSKVEIVGLPFELGPLNVSVDGTVYGLGFTLVYGTENWFTSVTSTWTETKTGGDLNSSISSVSVQPRIGLIKTNWQFWAGGMYLDTDEKHSGVFELPFIGGVPFAVELITKDSWNYGVGSRYVMNDRNSLSFELGFGNRQHLLINFNTRF